MLAIAATLIISAVVIGVFADMIRNDGRKILAALEGRSWAAEQRVSLRPVTVRFSPRGSPPQHVRAQPEWRAAA